MKLITEASVIVASYERRDGLIRQQVNEGDQ